MYSSLKFVAGASVVFSVINAVAGILSLMFLLPLEEIDYTMVIAMGGFMLSTSLIFLVLSFYLFSLYSDLSAHEESNFQDLSTLRKRLENIEKKMK